MAIKRRAIDHAFSPNTVFDNLSTPSPHHNVYKKYIKNAHDKADTGTITTMKKRLTNTDNNKA
jgi:hypothetical protein